MKQITIKDIEETRKALEQSIKRMIEHYEQIMPMIVEEIVLCEDKETGECEVMIKDYLTNNSKVYIKEK
jgi:DNA-binding ferritin-like protein